MKTILFVFLLIQGLTMPAYGLSDTCAVSTYFNTIYSAEIHLVEGNRDESMKLYYEAFNSEGEEKIIFIKDLHNALMLAYQNGNTGYFEKFMYHLNDYDVDSSFFETEGYEDLKDSRFYPIVRSFFANKIDSHRNSPVCEFFERLTILDQSIRKACREKYSGSLYYFCGEEIDLLDSLVLLQLKDYFEEHGIPKESEFCNVLRYSTPPYYLIIKHNLHWCRSEIIEVLKNQIGKVHPQVLGDILNYTYSNPCNGRDPENRLGLGNYFRLEKSLYAWTPPQELIDTLNQNRMAIHLDSIEHVHKKIIFQEFNPEYILVLGFNIPIIEADKEFIDYLKEKYKDIKVTEVKY